jgi:hypothetical protein
VARHATTASARRWPAWLATLALALHLLAPGLCLAQRLASAPLGALCSAEPGRATPAAAADETAAASHLLEHCDHCLPGVALLADSGTHRVEPPAAAAAPRPAATTPPAARAHDWRRPPSRAPPRPA